jgi:DNA-binding response OmpR family regulator
MTLDVALPGLDGFETCRRLRDDGVQTPILMLTARDAVDAGIVGLDTGADPYLTKPFDFGDLLSRYRLLDGGWDRAYEHRSNVIDLYVRYLGEKIDRPFGTETIETIRGAGYRLKAP